MKQGCTKKPVGDICKILNGFAFKSNEYVDDGVRVLRITNVQKGYIVDDDPQFFPIIREKEISKYMLYEGDLLMSLTGNVGRVGVLSEEFLPAALNQRVACLRIKESAGVNLKYLFHIFNSKTFEDDCIVNATGIAQKNMSTKWLENYLIPVPTIAEQEKIVAELDCLSGIIEKKKQQLKEQDNLAQSIFYEMFGDPVENDKGLDIQTLGDVAVSVNYGTSSPAREGGAFKYLRMNNLTYSGYLDLSDVKSIDANESEREKYSVQRGDILFNRTNSKELVGKTALFTLDEEMIIAGYIIRIRVDKSFVLPLYVVRYMNTPFMKSYFANLCKGAVNQANINSKELKNIPLPIPSLSLQEEFASKIESIEKQKELIAQSIKEAETLFNSRMDYYFN